MLLLVYVRPAQTAQKYCRMCELHATQQHTICRHGSLFPLTALPDLSLLDVLRVLKVAPPASLASSKHPRYGASVYSLIFCCCSCPHVRKSTCAPANTGFAATPR
jgi:hypothetical protein